MKTRIDEWITTVAFCAFLGIISLLFLILPKQEMSETEKRELESAPKFSWENLASGKFGEDIESYMADHIPGRDFFVGVNAYTELLSGRQVTKDIYLAAGDRLVERPVEWNEEKAQNNMSAVNSLAKALGQEVDFMIVPSGGWAVQDSIIGVSDSYQDEQIIQKLYAMAAEGVVTRDLATVFEGCEDPAALYYRTDHHWTSLGAYTAYAAYMEMLGLPALSESEFTVETVEGFTGTTHSRAALWLVEGEPLEMWSGTGDVTVTIGKNGTVSESVFFKERLQELDKYTVFLDGNHDIVTLENPDAPVDETILVVRDSYSNCFGPFLAQTYKKVVLVDLRSFNDAVVDYCGLNSVDRVLVMYSLYNFMTDSNLGKLDMTQNIHSIVTKTYSAEELEQIAAFEGDYYDYVAQYPIQCIKTLGESYRVAYLGADRVAVLYFNGKGEKLSGEVYMTAKTGADFDGIAVGDSMETVKQLDPAGYYPVISTGKDRVRSEHYTSDGFMITIYYDQDVIVEITKELI